MLLVKMAFRNLWRRRFRTIITLVAIGFSFALLLFFVSLTGGTHEMMIDTAIRMQAGHVIIQAREFQQDRSLELRLPRPDAIMERIGPVPENWIVTRRIFTTGLLRSSEGSVMLDNLMGVEPGTEARISDASRKLVKGEWLDDRNSGIVIGEKAARLLKVDVGDRVVLSCSGLTQKVEERLMVTGIFRMGGESDRGTAMMALSHAQEFLGMGTAVSQIAFFMPAKQSENAARTISARFSDPQVEVMHWKEALPVLTQLLWLDEISMLVFVFIIFGIVAAGILNTILMSVMERTREMGILKSLGMPPKKLFNLVMTEGLLLGIFAIAIGCLVGLPLTRHFQLHGIDILALTGGEVIDFEGVALSDRIHPVITMTAVAAQGLLVIVLTLASSVWPAIRAMRILPVKAIRQM